MKLTREEKNLKIKEEAWPDQLIEAELLLFDHLQELVQIADNYLEIQNDQKGPEEAELENISKKLIQSCKEALKGYENLDYNSTYKAIGEVYTHLENVRQIINTYSSGYVNEPVLVELNNRIDAFLSLTKEIGHKWLVRRQYKFTL